MSIAGQSPYDAWKTESPHEESPAKVKLGNGLRDQELIASGIRAALLAATAGRNVTAEYAPYEDFSGSVLLEIQIRGESDREAIRALYVELSHVLTSLLERTY